MLEINRIYNKDFKEIFQVADNRIKELNNNISNIF